MATNLADDVMATVNEDSVLVGLKKFRIEEKIPNELVQIAFAVHMRTSGLALWPADRKVPGNFVERI